MEASQADLRYVPKQEAYSYVEKETKKKSRKKILFIFLFFLILLATTSFILFVLNYFGVLNLTKINPIFNSLPASEYSLQNILEKQNANSKISYIKEIEKNVFTAQGVISYINENKIKVKLPDRKIIDLEITIDSSFYTQIENGIRNPQLAADFIKNNNKNKEVLIQFAKVGRKNLLQSIEIINNN